ncbi:MAG: sigma-70 family RNA polymerase sigma factor [Steroidobacteraceae bacterium]
MAARQDHPFMDIDVVQTDAAALPGSLTAERRARFETLLAANRPALARLAASYATSTADRDDLLQEIAMGLWLALPGFRAECSERTFLFRIAHNRCISHLARRRPQVSLDDLDSDPVDPGSGPDQGVSRAQQAEHLQEAVRRLPLPYRQVIVLLLEDLDYRQIAEVLGISETNVGARLTRARGLLRTLLGDNR